MTPMHPLLHTALVGAGATVLMDLWLLVLQRLGMATLDFALVGRWVGHVLRGTVRHAAIRRSPPVAGEAALGWFTHYAVGVTFAAALVAVQGAAWLQAPTPLPAVALGAATVAAPLLIMQPAMGAGIASSRTPTPLKNCLRSLANHLVFGAGLYLSAAALAAVLA